MSYSTQAALIERFGSAEIQQISDINQTGAIDAGRVTQYLADASTLIDGYISGRYALPIPAGNIPSVLEKLCGDLTRYMMAKRPTEEMRSRYTDAISLLKSVANGQFDLGLDPTGKPAVDTSGPTIANDPGRVFTSDTLCDYTTIQGSWS